MKSDMEHLKNGLSEKMFLEEPLARAILQYLIHANGGDMNIKDEIIRYFDHNVSNLAEFLIRDSKEMEAEAWRGIERQE